MTSLKKGLYSEKIIVRMKNTIYPILRCLKKSLFCKNCNSDQKTVFHQRVNKSMNLTFVWCVQERKTDTNPTHYTKFDQSTKNRETNSDMVWKFAYIRIYIYIYILPIIYYILPITYCLLIAYWLPIDCPWCPYAQP